jgi:hypothetical protein
MSSKFEKFKGHLVVAVHGPVENSRLGVSIPGVQQLSLMSNYLSNLVPASESMMLANGNTSYIEESASYLRVLGRGIGRRVKIAELDGLQASSENLRLIMSSLIASEANKYGILAIVTTSEMSGMLSGLHDKGSSHMNLREGCAYLTMPDGLVYAASSNGIDRI